MQKAQEADGLEPIALMCKGEHAKAARDFLTRVGDKWSILLVVVLAQRAHHRARFSELHRLIGGISQRHFRSLEAEVRKYVDSSLINFTN
jgi:DNA-binding HxlR family transcriptional regulator